MPETSEKEGRRRRKRSRHRNSDSSDLELFDESRVRLPRPGDVLADKYHIDEMLGRGGMGAVYAATHLVSGKRVAVKWMLPLPGHAQELTDRFIREARATARIDHPNVVDIYDVGRQDPSVYLVMELLHGESLAQRLDREPAAATEAVAMLMPALRGVAAAHAQGVIHRDLKPDNIYLARAKDGEARDTKVLDFGISKIVADERRDLSMTASGTVMGTPYYMSPEQIRGFRDVDARADVYAFGVILYEMLADCFPFDAETYNELILKIATTDPVPLSVLCPELNPALVAIVMRAMAREPGQRYQSVAELATALEPFAGGVPFRLSATPQLPLPVPVLLSSMRTETQAAVAPARRSRRPLLIAAVAVGLLLAGVGVGFWALRGAPKREIAVPAAVVPAVDGAPVAPAQAAPIAPAGASEVAPAAAAPAAAALPAVLTAEPEPARAAERPAGKSSRSKRQRAAEAEAASQASEPPPARETRSRGLPQDWDDRLSNQAPAAGRSGAAVPTGRAPRKSIAGELTPDDL